MAAIGEKRVWTYLGQRMTSDKKLAHCWRLHDTSEGLWVKSWVSGAPVGGRFEITMTGEGEKFWVSGDDRPKFLGLDKDLLSVRLWEAKDTAVKTAVTATRVMRKAKDDTQLSALLEPLHQLADRLPHNDRSAFINYVTAQLWRR